MNSGVTALEFPLGILLAHEVLLHPGLVISDLVTAGSSEEVLPLSTSPGCCGLHVAWFVPQEGSLLLRGHCWVDLRAGKTVQLVKCLACEQEAPC